MLVKKITGLQDNEMTTTKSGSDAPFMTYSIGVDTIYGTSGAFAVYGRYDYKNIKIVEKLPIGAIMSGEPDAEGYYVYYGSKWKYDVSTHTAIYN